MRAVGIVKQTGAYFFLASEVPRFGSSAMAALAAEHAAAATTTNIMSLLLLLSSFTIFSDSIEALTITTPRRGVVVGSCLPAAALPKNEVTVMVEAMGT